MYVLSVFEQTLDVELAVTALTEAGIPKQNILASSVEKKIRHGKFFDGKNSHNASSQFDLPMILGALISLMGCIYGYVLKWGPIIWGVLGGLAGFLIGLLIKLILFKKRQSGSYEAEVVILVSCEERMSEAVKTIFEDNGALGVSLIRCQAP